MSSDQDPAAGKRAPLPTTDDLGVAEAPATAEASMRAIRFAEEGVSLRKKTARGTIINSAFVIGLSGVSMLKGFVVATMLETSEYGLWGLLAATLGTLGFLKQVGIGDKYVQQDDPNQEVAFQRAFTLEAIVSAGFLGIVLVAILLLSTVFDLPEIVAPGLVLSLTIPATLLQTPLWVFFRRMHFVRQRSLQAINPLVGFVVTVALAATGFGVWSLVIGLVAGNWATSAACLIASPYRLRFRFDAPTARSYFGFSWPMFVAGISVVAMAQVPVLVATETLGLASVGAIALANLIPVYARQASSIVTQTMYPAVCAVKDRHDLLLESFLKSNRLGMLWGTPVGIALVLFAPDFSQHVIGEKWEFAVGLLQAMGLFTAINQFGYNWTAFYRARGETKPIAIASLVQAGAICGITVPLMIAHGLDGFAVGMGIAAVTYLAVRLFYLTRLFPAGAVLTHGLRAMVPTAVGAVAVISVRLPLDADRTAGVAAGEFALFVAAVAVVTAFVERALIREVLGYLRRSPRVGPSAA